MGYGYGGRRLVIWGREVEHRGGGALVMAMEHRRWRVGVRLWL